MDRLTEMEAFATVVDQGGFTDAAKKMGISKSAVSKHVSALEARLGARLLNRTTRRLRSTSVTPSSDSSSRMPADRVDCDTKLASAARPKWPCSCSATRYWSCFMVGR